jgi:hypothetical protein
MRKVRDGGERQNIHYLWRVEAQKMVGTQGSF